MANESGTWIMHGLDWDNPYRIRTYRELINWINEIGFLPLFKNEVEGFSAEEHGGRVTQRTIRGNGGRLLHVPEKSYMESSSARKPDL